MVLKKKVKAFFLIAQFCVFSVLTGCINVSPEALVTYMNPGEVLGSHQRLTEPEEMVARKSYAAETSDRTLSIPVVYGKPDTGFLSPVTRDTLGTPVTVGTFHAGEILSREFGKVFAANFRQAEDSENAIARFVVRIKGIVTKKKMMSSHVTCQISVLVQLIHLKSGAVGYSGEFVASGDERWPNESSIPPSFYVAVDSVLEQFLKDWSTSEATKNLLKWSGEETPHMKPPELLNLEFQESGERVFHGKCTVACNGYEGFQTKTWASTQIASVCRKKLGIEPERVRIIYDREIFDSHTKTWTFEFQTFARSEKVLTFDKLTRSGTITGDLGLMGMSADEASDVLKKFVLAEMDSRAGIVTHDKEKGRASVRFDDFTTDKTYNLITIRFRLVY